MDWNAREWVDRKEAINVVKNLKNNKIGRAIRNEGSTVEIYKMETDAILNERLPTYCWLVRCRDVRSAERFVVKLRDIAYSF